MTKAQRSYNAFVRVAKRNEGLTHREAQAAYRSMKDRLGQSPTAKDIKAHPRMMRDAVKAAKPPAPKKKAPAKKAAPKKAAKKKPAEKPPAKKAVKKAPAKRTAPPKGERLLHAGIRYKNKAGEVRVEIVLRLPKDFAYEASNLNGMLQKYAKGGELPRGVRVEMIEWQHGNEPKGSADDESEIEDARAGLLKRIAGAAEFYDMGGSEGNSGSE